MEEVVSVASSINPLLGIGISLIGKVWKVLKKDGANVLDKDFQQIHDRLESISVQSKQVLDQILISEIDENYGELEKNIEHQYRALETMEDKIRKNPEKKEQYREDFKEIYIKQQAGMNLNSYYKAIMEEHGPFGRPLLKDYLEHCNQNKKIMEAKCAHLAYLFSIGLMALKAYYEINGDDLDEFNEWDTKVIKIEAKMQEVLARCSE